MKAGILPFILFLICFAESKALQVLVPMDERQSNHLKAYGVVYNYLKTHPEEEVKWLLNYRGGAFVLQVSQTELPGLILRKVSYEVISAGNLDLILNEMASPNNNMEVVSLLKAPKIALYSPKSASPWDDAVSLAMSYAEIPYETIYDADIMEGKLSNYDWVHLHHEDFTGQMGKMITQRGQAWYQNQQREDLQLAQKFGFNKASALKLSVVKRIKEYVGNGGYLFAMCTATDTFDIALAAEGLDIADVPYDGDPLNLGDLERLDFQKCLAFQQFKLIPNARVNEFSNIDSSPNYSQRAVSEEQDFFELMEFAAKVDVIPSMLTQNHEHVIHGFMGQTTAFSLAQIKPEVTVLAHNESLQEAKYLYGAFGKGFFSFLGGHDPEDYQHLVNEEPTDLVLHPNSPGYRLILNNILFPSAKKKKQKT